LLFAIMGMFGKGSNKRQGKSAASAKTAEQVVQQIQAGAESLRNSFIAEMQPSVVKSASRYCREYIDPTQHDAFTIALAAFDEAIDRYRADSGKPFMTFADELIGSKLTEYWAKAGRATQAYNRAAEGVSFEAPPGQKERQGELKDLEDVLRQFNIQFVTLMEQSPQQSDTRKALFLAGRSLAEDAELMRLLIKSRKLPAKELAAVIQVPRKTIVQHAAYITFVAVLFNGPFPYLREYWHMEIVTPREGRKRNV